MVFPQIIRQRIKSELEWEVLHSDRILELAYSASKTYTATAYFKVGKPAEKSGDPAPCFKFEYKKSSGKLSP